MDKDKKCLESILQYALSFDEGIQKIINESKKLENEEVKTRVQDAIGYVMKELTLKIIFPIYKQYPELDNER